MTCDESLIDRVEEELNKQLNRIPRKAIAEVALRNSKIYCFCVPGKRVCGAGELLCPRSI